MLVIDFPDGFIKELKPFWGRQIWLAMRREKSNYILALSLTEMLQNRHFLMDNWNDLFFK